MIDPTLTLSDPFNAPIPGQSLTDEPKKWSWEQPPLVSDPLQAYEGIVESLENPLVKETLGRLMYIGVSIETLVGGIALKSFSEGSFSPDVAEIIKPALSFHLLKIANDAGVTPKILNELPEESLNDGMTLSLLKTMNPKKYMETMEKTVDKKEFKEYEKPSEGFMSVEGDE